MKAGMERMVTLIANELAIRSSSRQEIFIIEKIHEGKPAYPLNKDVQLLALSSLTEKGLTYKNGYLYCMYVLFGKLKELKLDCLIISDSYKGFYPLLISQLTRTKTILWEHNNCNVRHHDGGKFSLGRELTLHLGARLANYIVTLTQEDTKMWQKAFNPQGILTCIPNIAVTTIKNTYTSNNHVVLAVGRLVPQKGFDLLLQAWQKILPKLPKYSDWQLIIVGGQHGNDEFYNKIVSKCAETDRVSLLPPTENMEALYQEAGIFVLPSRYEGLPLVLIEAQALGIPAVAFDCPTGPAEVIDNKRSGYLVDPENINEYAEALLDLMNTPTRREHFSMGAKERGEQFSKRNIIPRWQELLEKIGHTTF